LIVSSIFSFKLHVKLRLDLVDHFTERRLTARQTPTSVAVLSTAPDVSRDCLLANVDWSG